MSSHYYDFTCVIKSDLISSLLGLPFLEIDSLAHTFSCFWKSFKIWPKILFSR